WSISVSISASLANAHACVSGGTHAPGVLHGPQCASTAFCRGCFTTGRVTQGSPVKVIRLSPESVTTSNTPSGLSGSSMVICGPTPGSKSRPYGAPSSRTVGDIGALTTSKGDNRKPNVV